jgi:hypothetical protein
MECSLILNTPEQFTPDCFIWANIFIIRVLARIIFNQKQAFSFNKREAKVYCYAFLHVLKRDTCIKHEKTIKKKFFLFFLVSCVPAGSARVPARHAKMPWLEI